MARKKNQGQKRAKKTQARKKKKQEKSKQEQSKAVQLVKSELTNEGDDFLSPPEFLDRRLMERTMGDYFGMGADRTPEQEQASDLYYEALESNSDRRRSKLLKQALEIDPRHIDAIVEMSYLASSEQSAIELLKQAISIGEEDLADELENAVGEFWGLFHTRPYMRAKHALSEIYFYRGDLKKSVEIMEDLLRLNPMDNQGIRWILMEVYCRLDLLDEAEDLVAKYPEDGVPFLPLTGILIEFRKHGDSDELRSLLRKQLEWNPHIIPRLLDPSLINKEECAMFSPGSPDEADLYCQQFLSAWRSTPGAITWLRSVSEDLPQTEQEFDDFDIKSEIQKLRKKVNELPQSPETWYFGPSHVDDEGWVFSVVDRDSGDPIYGDAGEDPYGPDSVLLALFESMLGPEIDEPRRPQVIEFGDEEIQNALRVRLDRLNIDAEFNDDRPEFLEFLDLAVPLPGAADRIDLEELQAYPISSTTWELDWRQLEQWLPGPSPELSIQPWMVLVGSEDELIIGQQMLMESPERDAILTTLAQAIERTDSRPQTIYVPTNDQLLDVKPVAEDLGVACQVRKSQIVHRMFDSLLEHMSQSMGGPPALISTPEATPEVVGDFFVAAAEFYNTKIWMKTPDQTVVKVEARALLPEPKFAVIMGQLGEEIGVLFFDNLKSVDLVMSGDVTKPGTNAQHISGLSWSFNDLDMTHPADAAAAEQFGWPVAAPEAWPMAFSLKNGSLGELTVDDLGFIAAGTTAAVTQLESDNQPRTTQVVLHDRTVEVNTEIV